MQPFRRRRAFSVALGLSLATHLGFAVAMGTTAFRRMVEPQPIVIPPRPQPQEVRLRLVNTPPSAQTAEPPRDSPYISNRNTRAQDRTPRTDESLPDQPALERRGDATDLRASAQAPDLGIPEVAMVPAEPALRPEPVQPPTPEPVDPAAPPKVKPEPEPPDRTQPAPAAVQVAPPKPREEPPPAPEPPVQPLPKKDSTFEQREREKLRKEMAALSRAADPRDGRASVTVAEAEEMASARFEGEFSYGAAQHYFGQYLLEMKEKVERYWLSRLLSDYSRVLHSRVVIDFKIYADGSVGAMRIVEATGDRHIFPGVCVQSIADAAPFAPVPYAAVNGVPPELVNQPLNIRFTFQYN